MARSFHRYLFPAPFTLPDSESLEVGPRININTDSKQNSRGFTCVDKFQNHWLKVDFLSHTAHVCGHI